MHMEIGANNKSEVK